VKERAFAHLVALGVESVMLQYMSVSTVRSTDLMRTQTRLLWRATTCSAHAYLIASWTAQSLLFRTTMTINNLITT